MHARTAARSANSAPKRAASTSVALAALPGKTQLAEVGVTEGRYTISASVELRNAQGTPRVVTCDLESRPPGADHTTVFFSNRVTLGDHSNEPVPMSYFEEFARYTAVGLSCGVSGNRGDVEAAKAELSLNGLGTSRKR